MSDTMVWVRAWAQDELQFLLHGWHLPIGVQARALGRTEASVRSRRARIASDKYLILTPSRRAMDAFRGADAYATAIHEAGHVWGDHITGYGAEIASVHIDQRGNGSVTHTTDGMGERPTTDWLVGACGGPVAEAYWLSEVVPGLALDDAIDAAIRSNRDGDFKDLTSLARSLGNSKWRHGIVEGLRSAWPAVRELAADLVARSRLAGSDAVAYFQDA